METVNNLASVASRAIWGGGDEDNTDDTQTGTNGTTGREPVSGQTGNVANGEPYDKGNSEPSSTKTTDSAASNPSSTDPEPTTAKTDKDSNVREDAARQPERFDPAAAGSVTGDPSSAPQNTQKHQGADRPSEGPGEGETDRIKETKKEAEEAAAVDVSGPGPKTLEEKAKEGGGTVGAGGNASGGDDDGPQKESHGEGTGEKYVKSSGMKADGGDFDASQPGAGREADRLLEEKGIHHEVGQAGGPKPDEPSAKAKADKNTPTSDGKEGKPSLKEKIMAKLHKN